MPLIVASHWAFGGGFFISPRRRGREPARAAVPCTLHGGKGRHVPCDPAFARSQPTARRSERRAARGWTARARAYHRAASRYGLLSTLRIEARGGKRRFRHRPGTRKTHLLATPMHPRQAIRVKAARNFQKLFPPRLRATAKPLGTCRPFLLDSRWRGGARMASRAKARRARRKSGAHARAAFAR